MIIELANCRVIDPTQTQRSGLQSSSGLQSIWIQDDRIIDAPVGRVADRRLDQGGAWVMAGGVDLHTHIGGGKVNLARMLMSHATDRTKHRSFGGQGCIWPTTINGQLYAQMGYTTCFEPAMMLTQARHTHLELSHTPVLDTGAYVVLGNEDWLLSAMGRGVTDECLKSLIAWSVRASQALAVKVVNPGGINAFKFNQRALDVDQPHPVYGVSPREVIRRLTAAVDELPLPHPLHVHASNLGVPGNIRSTLATLEATEGRRLHLTHAQFNCYSGPLTDGDAGYAMGSAAESLSRYVNEHPNISIDVGQVVFGQTVTISADEAAQFRNRKFASPKNWTISDVECQAGCGVVPMVYSDLQYIHSLQWTIGLELLLLIKDPWRVFLTTDHPNGGPFTSYPHLIRLLMDRSFRQSMLATIHPKASERSLLKELDREYSIEEIAIITRCGPSRILGLVDRGTLKPGAQADIVAYQPKSDWQATFSDAALLLKGGAEVINDGKMTEARIAKRTHKANIPFDKVEFGKWQREIEEWLSMPCRTLTISDDELAEINQY